MRLVIAGIRAQNTQLKEKYFFSSLTFATSLYGLPAYKPIVLPVGISVLNIDGTIIHSGLGIKPGKKLFGLNDKSKAALKSRSSEVNVLTIDELSMVSSDS